MIFWIIVFIIILLFIIYRNTNYEHFKDNCAPSYTPVINVNYNRELNNTLFGMSGNDLQDIFDSIIKKNQSKYMPSGLIKIKKQQYDYYSGLTDLYIVNYDELVVYLDKIIDIINNRIIIKDLNDGYFILQNYYLQSIYKNDNGDKRYVVIFEIYQENKLLMKSVLTDFIIYKNKDFKINRLILKSVISKDNLGDIKGNNAVLEENISIKSNFPGTNRFNPQDYYMSSNVKDVLPKNEKENSVDKQINKKDPNKFRCIYPGHKIVNNQIKDRNICQSDNDGMGIKTKRGVWDRNCSNDSECPFYKSNKNYKNNFGGCVDGICQLPVNMVSISPHFYDETKKPLCYNCLGNSSDCCEEQKDKSKYPNLLSPDYAFLGDQNKRKTEQAQLLKRGLYNKYIK